MKGETRPIRRAKESRGRRLRFGAAAATSLLLLGSLGGGCAASSKGEIEQSGEGASSDIAGIMAKVDDVTARLDLAFRKIDNSRQITQDAARDIVNKEVASAKEETLTAARDIARTETKTGLGDWALVWVVVGMRVADVAESWVATRRRNDQCRIPDEFVSRRLGNT